MGFLSQTVAHEAITRASRPPWPIPTLALARADETKIVLHQTIESVLRRGEKLDALVEKSNDLSLASQMFYKQAKKANSCCQYA